MKIRKREKNDVKEGANVTKKKIVCLFDMIKIEYGIYQDITQKKIIVNFSVLKSNLIGHTKKTRKDNDDDDEDDDDHDVGDGDVLIRFVHRYHIQS